MTLDKFYREITAKIAQNGIKTAELDAKILIMHHLDYDLGDFILNAHQDIPEKQQKAILSDANKRINGQPVSSILQKTEFWGLEFKTTQHTLDPRPDTETLIEAALKWLNHVDYTDKEITICDLGTGTGCIPIALLHELPNARAVAVDISKEALDVARHNAKQHKMSERIEFIQGSWMNDLDDYKFHLITSNPPYITNQEIEKLDIEVKNHDPVLALSGGHHRDSKGCGNLPWG